MGWHYHNHGACTKLFLKQMAVVTVLPSLPSVPSPFVEYMYVMKYLETLIMIITETLLFCCCSVNATSFEQDPLLIRRDQMVEGLNMIGNLLWILVEEVVYEYLTKGMEEEEGMGKWKRK